MAGNGQGIKNNLSDALKKHGSKGASSSSVPVNTAARTNKFKPATSGRPQAAASSSSRMPAPLPSFSTPGFNKPRDLSARTPSILEIDAAEYEASSQSQPPPESQTPSQSQAHNHHHHARSSSSQWQGSTSASSSAPYPSSSSSGGVQRKKRLSSDLSSIECSSPKRVKNNTKEKENVSSSSTRPSQDTRDKGKGKVPSTPISAHSSPRANRKRPPPPSSTQSKSSSTQSKPTRNEERPWDDFEIQDDNPFSDLAGFPGSRSPIKKATPGPSTTPAAAAAPPPRQPTSPPPKPPESEYIDLNDKSVDALKEMLEWNNQAMSENFVKYSEFYKNGSKGDRFILDQFKRVLEDRIAALEKMIKEKTAYERKIAERASSSVLPPVNPAPSIPPTPAPRTFTPPFAAGRETSPFVSAGRETSYTGAGRETSYSGAGRSNSPPVEIPTRPSTPVEEIITASQSQRRAAFPPPAPPPVASSSTSTAPVARTSHHFAKPLSSNTIIIDDDAIDIDGDDDSMWQALGGDMSDDAIEMVSSGISRAVLPPSQAPPYEFEIMRVLRSVFSLESFRTNQREAITATLSGKDVFVLMPTGGGKSLCYQLPAVCTTGETQGVTFVVSPLLALMHDQVSALEKKGVDVLLWNSERTQDDVRTIMQRLSRRNNLPKAVYITPEKIKESPLLRTKLRELYEGKKIARFVIDEAHCISSWGRDFREAYQELHVLREEYPDVPIMALTATANRTVADDIRLRLRMRPNCVSLTQSFNRPNLHYTILPKQTGKKGKSLEAMATFIKERHPGESGVIYCFSRNDCEKVAMTLRNEHGLKAKHFHAGMDAGEKAATQQEWQSGRVAIIVATIAFGMGIDKADVRFVIHHSAPKSMDGYYQETGRAGRDGKPADCVLYYDYGDCKKLIQLIRSDRTTPRPTPANMRRQEDGVHEVIEFCHNNTECRRSYVLRYFGETFSPADCSRSCDVCLSAELHELTTADATQQAHTIIQLVETLSDGPETNVSEKQAQNVYLGANLKELRDKGLDRHPLFGAGKGQPKELVGRLFADLIVGNALELVSKENSAGWHTTYVTLGSKVKSFRTPGKKIMVSYRPSGMAFAAGRNNLSQ